MPLDFVNDPLAGVSGPRDAQLSFDFSASPRGHKLVPRSTTASRQRTNYHAGLCAEDAALRAYRRNGAVLLERRWRGPGGEIDLILAEDERMVFVEVKTSKTHAHAVQRVTTRQMARITASAEAYLGRCPKGALTEARIDVALVDARGAVDIVTNAGLAA